MFIMSRQSVASQQGLNYESVDAHDTEDDGSDDPTRTRNGMKEKKKNKRLRALWNGPFGTIVFLFVYFCIGALYYQDRLQPCSQEERDRDDPDTHILRAIYFVVVTVTTVGYGDYGTTSFSWRIRTLYSCSFVCYLAPFLCSASSHIRRRQTLHCILRNSGDSIHRRLDLRYGSSIVRLR